MTQRVPRRISQRVLRESRCPVLFTHPWRASRTDLSANIKQARRRLR